MKFGITHIKEITKQNIVLEVGYDALVKRYIKGFVDYGKRFHSELREDKNPSCVVYQGLNEPRYKDFSLGDNIDIFTYMQIKFNAPFSAVLRLIIDDFNLKGYKGTGSRSKELTIAPIELIKAPSTAKTNLFVKYRDFEAWDIIYWQSFGISLETLKHYKVKPISHYWVSKGDDPLEFTAPQYCYAYYFGSGKYKIYSPYNIPGTNNIDSKWWSNCGSMLQGYDQLPWYGELLVVTKSYKDVMVFHEMNTPAVAPQSESSFIPADLIDQLKKRFEKIIVYYDNDEAGIKAAEKHYNTYKIDFCYHHETPKDPSDLIQTFGTEKGKQIILNTIHTKWQPKTIKL